jgi:molybdopterin converting factor small subunit
MKVWVRLFAALREAAGRDRIELDLPEPATVGQCRRRLAEAVPGLGPQMGAALFAIDARYAADNETIDPGKELACFPPVSGG